MQRNLPGRRSLRMRFAAVIPALCFATLARAELTEEQKRVPLEVVGSDASMARIVLLAGPPSNKPGQHEYFAGCALLMKCLRQTPGVWPVMAAEGWPRNEAILDGARSVVLYMDGGPKCALFEGARWAAVGALVKRGAGLVVLHQAVDIPEDRAAEFREWAGAVWQKDVGCRGHWDMAFDPKGAHEALRGVAPFAAPKDGWLFNLHFAERNVTPLLSGAVPDKARTTPDALSRAGRAEVVAWAHERGNGGRSFGFTGCDLHGNWGVEAQRRFVVNGILWSARVGVPEGGAPVAMDPADLSANLDRKVFSPAAKKTAVR